MQTTDSRIEPGTLPTEEQFREEALAFLSANAEKRPPDKVEWGVGSDSVELFADKTPEQELEDLENSRAWRMKSFDAGFGWITGPTQYGGRGLPNSYQAIYNSLESNYKVPSQGPFGIGLGMVAPTILAHATESVKTKYLRSMYRGDIVGCQLFSEPSSGSDLASLQTKAERDGDEWIINGQKVWTSGAQFSDIGEIICRTDPTLPKHKGLTGFVVDMKAPGVEVRPLRQMTGGASFNEVFFNNVRVPNEYLLGDVNQGWTVALTTLMNERAAIGGSGAGIIGVNKTFELLMQLGSICSQDPIARQQIADLYIHMKASHFTSMRAMAKVKAGQLPGPEMSLGKLSLTNNLQRIGNFVSHVLGPKLIADTGEWGTYSWASLLLGTPGIRVAGGTDEVMKNIIGERVLGLPKEPKPAVDRI